MDGTLLHDDDGYVLRFERHLAHSVERVWRAVTEPAELAGWFPGIVEIEPVVGAPATFGESGLDIDSELLPTLGTVVAVDPLRVFAFSWGDDLLRFELTPDAGGCVLVFTHRFENRASAPRSAAGWNMCVDALVTMVDGGGATRGDGRGDVDRWKAFEERYTDLLGTQGTFTRRSDCAVLRFERVLDHDTSKVWDALTDPRSLALWLADASFDLVEGGCVELRFDTPPGYVVTGVVTRMDVPRVLEYTWTAEGEPEGVVKWQLIPVGERTILLFTHTVHGDWDAAGTLAAWDVHHALLAGALAGLPAWPFPAARWEELRRSYLGALG